MSQPTKIDAYDHFGESEGIISQVKAIAALLMAVREDEIIGGSVINNSAEAMHNLLSIIEKQESADFKERREQWQEETAAKDQRNRDVAAYLDPATDEETRAQLEDIISDDDITAELDQIKHSAGIFDLMHKRNEKRVQLINSLKAKRAETAEA